MGGAGFGQGVMQGLKQSQDRQLQMQQLQLQQDLAKYQQKHMETQDQMAQLNLHSLQQKMDAEMRLPSMMEGVSGVGPQAAPLGEGEQGAMPVPNLNPQIDRQKLVSLLQVAQQAGQDPMQLLQLMSLNDPRIKEIHDSLQPEKFTKLAEGEQLVSERTGESKARGAPKTVKPVEVSPGNKLVDPATGQVTFESPAAPPKPPDYGNNVESAASVYLKQVHGVEGGSFTDLLRIDPVAAQKVRNQAVVDEPSKIRSAAPEFQFAMQEKKVLSPTEANTLGVPFGTTHEDAKGIMPITAQQREALAHYDTARVIINDIKQYSDKINTEAGGLVGRGKQAMKLWGGWTQSNTNAALLMSKAGELASVARSLGEKGALANQDVARAAALIPSVIDTREVAQQKLKDMLTIIDSGEQNFRKSLGVDARAPGKSKPPPVQEPDPTANIPVPPGLSPKQADVYKRSYMEQKDATKRKMQPSAQAKQP